MFNYDPKEQAAENAAGEAAAAEAENTQAEAQGTGALAE